MNTEILLWGLEELSDKNFQERVWLGKSVGEMSSFDEAVCATFDDSGLGILLDSDRRRTEIPPDQRELAIKLSRLVKKIPRGRSPSEVIDHPAMQSVRETAKELLMILKG
jgi:hypothetical protein